MEHSFNIEIAQKYGVNAAIVLRHIQFWIIKNKTHNKHIHDGRTWTYYSLNAFTKIFPYLSKKQVRRALQILLDNGVILKADYNKYINTRTSWYAFVDESLFVPEGRRNKSSCAPEGTPDKSSCAPEGTPKKKSSCAPEGTPCAPEGTPFAPEGTLFTDKDKQISETDESTDKSRISQEGGLSSKDSDKHYACTLLRRYGVDVEVARQIVYDQHIPLESITEVIKNGLAKEIKSKQTDGRFVLEAGYIIKTLNQARSEGKTVGPTKLSKALAAKLSIPQKDRVRPSPAEIRKRVRRMKAQVAAMKDTDGNNA